VVIVGGGEIGVETGIYLCHSGKQVTVLEQRERLAADSTPVHYYKMFRDEWEKCPTFQGICNATVTAIDADGVHYLDETGAEQIVPADHVILSVGMRARTEEALQYSGMSKYFYQVGDCRKVGNIQTCMRTAYLTASQL
jgi:NADPH-dependent 2,4-dienoyl-CoA reductase/sulfur reductase-like enzyme